MATGSSFLNEKFVRKSSISNLVIYCHRNCRSWKFLSNWFPVFSSQSNRWSETSKYFFPSKGQQTLIEWGIVDDFIFFNGMMDRNKLRSMLVHCFVAWMVNQSPQRFQGDSKLIHQLLNEWKYHLFNKLMDFRRLIWISIHTRPPSVLHNPWRIASDDSNFSSNLTSSWKTVLRTFNRLVTVFGRRLCFANN